MPRVAILLVLSLALLSTVGFVAGALFAKPSRSCSRYTVPVKFTKIETQQLTAGRTTRPFPLIEFTYTISGTRYYSKRIFCPTENRVEIDWAIVKNFFEAAEQSEPIVAWVSEGQPANACISLTNRFDYSTVGGTSPICRAPP